MSKIIYPTDSGIAVVHPTDELSIEQVALKDIPAGSPFLIIADEDVPEDRTFRAAWTADFSNPDGYGIGHDAWVARQESLNADHD